MEIEMKMNWSNGLDEKGGRILENMINEQEV